MKYEHSKKYIVILVGLLILLPLVTASKPTPEPRGVPRVVLAENFTEWGCPPCAATNPAWYAALDALGYDVVVPAMIHVWWPAGGDPWYNYDVPNNQIRVAEYSVAGVPDRETDGMNINWNQAQAGFEADILAAQARDDGFGPGLSPLSISSVGLLDNNTKTGTIDITIQAVDVLPAADYRLIAYFWETNITRYTNPNGETENRWAVWDYYPDAVGDPVFQTGANIGDFVNIHYDLAFENEWDIDQLGMTVFVQNFDIPSRVNYNVLQAHVQTFDFVNTLPTVTLLDNNGQAEDGTWASTQTVTWTATDPDEPDADLDITIVYSPNNGTNWYLVESGVDNNDGSCTWDTTGDADGTEYLLRVGATDSQPFSPAVFDYSDAVFTIDNTPTIDLTAPDGGEVWMGGSSQFISWDMDDFYDPINQLSVELRFSTDGGTTFPPGNIIASGLTGFGANPCSYNWNPIPVLDNIQIQVQAIVTDTDAITASDDSLANFEIDSTAPAPATNVNAELTAPNHVTIQWAGSGSPDVDHYEIYYRLNAWDPTGDTYTFLVDTGMTTSFQHNNVGINNPSSYYWQVRTYDVAGHETRTIIQAGKTGSTQSTFANPSGWFMLGSHLQQSDTSLAHVIQGAGLPANWDCVQVSDAVNGDWDSYLKNRPASKNDLTDITNEQGFWLHVTSSTRFATAGYVEDMSIPLEAGWNLVPYPFAEKTMNTASIMAHLSANCPNYVGMQIFDSGSPYRVTTPGGSETLAHGSGFWVEVSASSTWTVTNY